MEKLKVILLNEIEMLQGDDRLKNDIINLIKRGKLKVWQTDKVEL